MAWAYKHDARSAAVPGQSQRADPRADFKQTAGEAVFSKARVINTLGNRAVHSHAPMPAVDALAAVRELFHVCYWLARTYARRRKPAPGLAFDPTALPQARAGPPKQTARPAASSSKRSCASGTRSSRRCWPTRTRSTPS